MKMNIVVSNNGKIVSTELYDWNENTKTFSTNLSELVLDFGEINGVTIKCGCSCTIKCGSDCTIRTYWDTEIVAGKNCILNYIYDGICECYKLPEQKKCEILKNGTLEFPIEKTETELQIEKLRSELNLLEQKYLQEKSGK